MQNRNHIEKSIKISKVGVFALLLASSLTIMVGTVIAPSLTIISPHLGFGNSPGWLITLPSLGVVLFASIMGKLIDKKGPFVMMCIGLIPYAIFGILGALLNNFYFVVVDRLLLGAATAAVQASATGLIAELYSGESRMKMISKQGMAIEFGGVIFLSIGGVLGELKWYFPFFIYLMALLCLVLILKYIPRIDKSKVDAPQKQEKSRISKRMTAIIILSTSSMILFFVAFIGLPLHLPSKFAFTDSQTGYFMGFISLDAVFFASLMPKIVKKMSEIKVLAIGFFGFAVGLFLFGMADSFLLLLTAALATGMGFGFSVPLLNHMVIEASTTVNRGVNLGYYSMAIFGGQFLSSLFTETTPNVIVAFYVAAAIALIIAFFLLGNRKNFNKL